MPKEGWSSITVSDEVFDRLDAIAKRNKRSIPNMLEILIDDYKRLVK